MNYGITNDEIPERRIGEIVEGERPDYIPPHLRGQVFDFRNENDGTISFAHPEAHLGLSPRDSRVKLTKEQYNQTFDPLYQKDNWTDSMNSMYAPLNRIPKTQGQKLNEGIANYLRKAFDWGTSDQGKAVGTAGLLSALAGGVGSYMWGRHTGDPSISRSLLLALLAGGLGAAGTAYAQNKHNRREAWLAKSSSAGDVTNGLIRMLENDPSLSSWERAQLLRTLAGVDRRDRDELYRLARTSIGVGAGILVMRFLKAKGLLPMLAGGILGGMLGSVRDPGLAHNALGQISMTNYL
jgi:hypothetical protein